MKMFNKIWQSAVIASMVVAPLTWSAVTIYMCGDSTMQDWNEGYYPKQGMGQDFGYFFDASAVSVYNAGRGGTTSQTYYDGHWKVDFKKNGVTYPAVSGLVQKGDYVFIMFGANDNGYKTGETNFKNSIGGMVTESRAKGAIPILLAPIRRSSFTNKDSIYESYHAYPIYMRQVADSLKVPLIDLDTLSRNYLISTGELYAHRFVNMFINDGEYSTSGSQTDNQHLQQMGANDMARMVTEQMRIHRDADVKALANYLAPMYQVDVKVSPAGSDSATTLSAYYPQGMKVTLKTIPKAGKKFVGWFDGNGNKVSGNAVTQIRSNYMYSFAMGNKSTQYTAVYEGGSAIKYTGDGSARKTFPTDVPKCIGGCSGNVSSSSITPTSSSSFDDESSSSHVSLDIKRYFDAHAPDEGVGFSENNHENYTGEGFFNFANEMNSYANYKMVFPKASRVTMAIRYSFAGNADRMVNVYLDHDYYVFFEPTGSWDEWDTAYVDIDLLSGENTLQFISMSNDGGPNIDAFGFSINGVCRVGEECPEVNDSTDSSETIIAASAVRPEQVRLNGDVLKLNGIENARIDVFDMRGRLVAKRIVENASEVSLANLVKSTGLYRVVVKQGSARFSATYAKVK